MILTCLVPLSNRDTLKHPQPERPANVQEMMKHPLAATQDNEEEGVRSDALADPEVGRQGRGFMDALFDLDESCQDAFTKQLTSVMYMPDLSLFPLKDEQYSASTRTTADARTSVDPRGLHTQSFTNNQPAADQLDENFLKLLDPDMLNQHPSDPCPQDSAPSQALSVEIDVSFSSTGPLPASQLLPEEMQPPPIQISRHPPIEYEAIKNYWSGKKFSNNYLDEIRGAVDPAFSNENWGDEYYFSGLIGFKHLEDFKHDSEQRVNDIATLEGLQLRANAIPHRTAKESWNSYYATMSRLAGGDRKDKGQILSSEGKGRGIRRPIMLTDSPSFQHALMQSIPPVTPVASGSHAVRCGTAPVTPRKIDSRGDIELVGHRQLQQRSW